MAQNWLETASAKMNMSCVSRYVSHKELRYAITRVALAVYCVLEIQRITLRCARKYKRQLVEATGGNPSLLREKLN